MMASFTRRLERLTAVQEVWVLWAMGFLGIVLSYVLFQGVAKVVATLGFLYLPLLAMDKRGEDYEDYGVTFRNWRQDLKLFAVLAAIVGPLFFAGFWAFAELLQHLPPSLAQLISPLSGPVQFKPRLPDRFESWVVDQVFVVALPEEFFYRGYIQTRLRDAWPQGRMFFGARLGRAFFVTALLFAVGHLAIFQVWRLAVFFPALVFGWMRERTGTVMGAALFHAACNLYEKFLEASFFGRL